MQRTAGGPVTPQTAEISVAASQVSPASVLMNRTDPQLDPALDPLPVGVTDPTQAVTSPSALVMSANSSIEQVSVTTGVGTPATVGALVALGAFPRRMRCSSTDSLSSRATLAAASPARTLNKKAVRRNLTMVGGCAQRFYDLDVVWVRSADGCPSQQPNKSGGNHAYNLNFEF